MYYRLSSVVTVVTVFGGSPAQRIFFSLTSCLKNRPFHPFQTSPNLLLLISDFATFTPNIIPMSDQTPKKFYQSTNFWLAVLMIVGSFWGLTTVAGDAIGIAFNAIIGAVGAVIIWLNTKPKFDAKKALDRKSNLWMYLTNVILGILPMATDLVPALQDVVEAITLKQYSLIISRLFTLGTVIWVIIRGRAPKPATQ